MAPADVPTVSHLDTTCFSTPWSDQAYYGELRHNNARYYVAEIDGVMVGFGGMWIILDEITINRLAVEPRYRRHGVGRLLLKHMMEEGVALGAVAATLEVRTTNPAAIILYERMGFRTAGIRKGYYEDSGEDAMILWNHNITETLKGVQS